MGVARVWGVNALDGKLMWSDLSSVGFGTLTVSRVTQLYFGSNIRIFSAFNGFSALFGLNSG